MRAEWRIGYLFGRVCRLGEDGLPVRPYKHDEREVEEDQVDDCRETLSTASGSTAYTEDQHHKNVYIRNCCCHLEYRETLYIYILN